MDRRLPVLGLGPDASTSMLMRISGRRGFAIRTWCRNSRSRVRGWVRYAAVVGATGELGGGADVLGVAHPSIAGAAG